MAKNVISLSDYLEFDSLIDVVDIGANPIDEEAPYKLLLNAGLASVIGFDPNPEAVKRLNAKKGPNEIYFSDAVFDGKQHELKVCAIEGMTSLLEPNTNLLNYFHGFPEWGKVKERLIIPTVRLDDFNTIKNIDYLKIDIQGGELEVFRNGVNKLRHCLVIHTEVEFLPMYKGQPLFSEVEMFLRDLGFVFHRFAGLHSRTIHPMLVDNDIYKGLSQLFWADAVFIKDFTNLDQLSLLQLKKLALILHDVYGSFDVVHRTLIAHDKNSNNKLSEGYIDYFM